MRPDWCPLDKPKPAEKEKGKSINEILRLAALPDEVLKEKGYGDKEIKETRRMARAIMGYDTGQKEKEGELNPQAALRYD